MLDGTVGEPPLSELAEIKPIEGGFEISIPHVDLDSEQLNSGLVFEIELKKIPCNFEEGESVGHGSQALIIDLKTNPTEKSEAMIQAAHEIGQLPAEERPRKIIELVRSNVQYAYKLVIENLKQTDPGLAKWVEENAGIGVWKPQSASDIVKAGYGVCKHLAGLAVILAQEAGLECSLDVQNPANSNEALQNITRPDDGERLFKSYDEGQSLGTTSHAWVSFLVNGNWIPADPSTNLVGDNSDELAAFDKANYYVNTGNGFNVEGLPTHVNYSLRDLAFRSNQESSAGELTVKTTRMMNLKGADTPTNYKGPISFTVTFPRNLDGVNAKISSIKLKS